MPAKGPNAPGSPSRGRAPESETALPTVMNTAASRPTIGAQRHGASATNSAATARMIGPGGTVGNPGTPLTTSITRPAAARTRPPIRTLEAGSRVFGFVCSSSHISCLARTITY